MSLKTVMIVAIVSFCIGGALSHLWLPRVEERVQEKVVTKNHIVTEIKEVVKPDGTKETDTTITDTSTKKEDSSRLIQRNAPQWQAYLGVRTSLELQPIYQFGAARRLFGPVLLGVSVSTDKTVGAFIVIEF